MFVFSVGTPLFTNAVAPIGVLVKFNMDSPRESPGAPPEPEFLPKMGKNTPKPGTSISPSATPPYVYPL